jgi:hypothetical protein
MKKYQVKFKLVNITTNNVILESVLYSTFNPKNRILFNSEEEAHTFMRGVEKSAKKSAKKCNCNDFKLEYELYDSKIKIKNNQ